MRTLNALAVLFLASAPPLQAGDGLAGYWKFSVLDDWPVWLLKIESKDGKLSGAAEGLRDVPPATLTDVRINGARLSFTLTVKVKGGRRQFSFEGVLPKAKGKKILGAVTWGDDDALAPAQLEATTAKDGFEVEKEFLTRFPNHPRVFAALQELIAKAAEKKVPLKDLEEWTESVLTTAQKHGPRFLQETALKYAALLISQEGYAKAAVTAARRADKTLSAKDPALDQLAVLDMLAMALGKAGEPVPDALQSRIAKLEPAGREEHHKKVLDFKLEKFGGRKGKSRRVGLVELFTGAQCPPCVAADAAFDGLGVAYKSSEVVLLQYHEHIPLPDALTNADSAARLEYYKKSVAGTPTVFLNGKSGPRVGGGLDAAAQAFKALRRDIDPLLENPAQATLQLQAARKGDKIRIKASAGVEKPGAKLRLRLALVEEWVRYRGRNGLSYHQHVVRSMPAGPNGAALTKKENALTTEVDLADVRQSLNKYLDAFHKSEDGPLLDEQRPMRLQDLRVVAFIQNDDTREVLQAMEVVVTGP